MKLYHLPSYPIRMPVSSICSRNNIILLKLGLIATGANSLLFLIHRTVERWCFWFLWEDDPFRNQNKLLHGENLKMYTLFRFDISSFLAASNTSAWIMVHKDTILSVHLLVSLSVMQLEMLENNQFLNVRFKLNTG